MSFSPEIHLLKGFSGFNFGQTKLEAIVRFGQPEEEQDLKDDILDTATYVMHYWEQGFSLFFDSRNNHIMNSVEVDNPETILLNERIFTLKEHEIIALLKLNGYALTDTENHEWGEKRISFDDANLDCYFENGKLVSVNFGVSEISNNFYFSPN